MQQDRMNGDDQVRLDRHHFYGYTLLAGMGRLIPKTLSMTSPTSAVALGALASRLFSSRWSCAFQSGAWPDVWSDVGSAGSVTSAALSAARWLRSQITAREGVGGAVLQAIDGAPAHVELIGGLFLRQP